MTRSPYRDRAASVEPPSPPAKNDPDPPAEIAETANQGLLYILVVRAVRARGSCELSPCISCSLCFAPCACAVMASVKRQNLPFAVKLEIINRVERGEKKSDVTAAYKIPRSTLSTILKNKAEIRDKADKRPGARGTRRVRTAVYEDVEAAVYKWFFDVRSRNLPVSGPKIEQKAKDMAFLLGREDFQGGSGWLQRLKERHEIVGKAVTGESRAVDFDSVNKWMQENWPDITARYEPRDIFNADETVQMMMSRPRVSSKTKTTLPTSYRAQVKAGTMTKATTILCPHPQR